MSRNAERPSGLQSSLGAYAPSFREADPANGRSAGAFAWREMGLLVAKPEHFGWVEETQIKQLAEQLYGKRREEN